MRPLKDVLPANVDNVLYVFYDFESTQNKRYSDTSKAQVLKLICVQQFCTRCEGMEGGANCKGSGRRRHSFRDDTVGDLLTNVFQPQLWANKILEIPHNAKAFDLHSILNRAIFQKWKPDLITNGLKIINMKMEQLVYLESVSFLPYARSKLWRPLNHGTRNTLTLRKTAIIKALFPTYHIMVWTK
jgi:hypothetical protein